MSHCHSRLLRTAFLLAALFPVTDRVALWAGTCPSASLSITRTTPAGNLDGANESAGLTGDVWVFFTPTGLSNTATSLYTLKVYGSDGVEVFEQDGATAPYTKTGELYFDWQTGSMRRPWGLMGTAQPARGPFQLQVESNFTLQDGTPCSYQSQRVTCTLSSPLTAATDPDDKLNMVCGANDPPAQTGSETDPMTGNQSWSIPVTSWPYHHNTYGLTLTYSSVGMEDPGYPDQMNLAGLSEKNSHWTHNFAMWLTLPIDETGANWAVVHRPGHPLTFKAPASGTTYTSLNSYDALVAGPNLSPAPSVTYPCNGAPVTTAIPEPGFFTLTDRDGTVYRFGGDSNGGLGPVWQIGECSAIPYYLLTSIIDRWGREVDLTWTDVIGNGLGWRVTQVSNPSGPTLTLSYSNTTGLMSSARLSTDPAGVNAVSLGYNGVNDETGTPRQKLTTVTVNGPAAAASRSRTWSFVYRDSATEQAAYSGTVTGDLVIEKTRPDGLSFSYVYAPVTLPRIASADYDGRFVSVSWPDSSEGTMVTRTISRAVSGNLVTLTYPGSVQTQYGYTGSDLTSLTELANTPAARTWTYAYDAYHNLTKAWSPLEPTSGNPLIQHDYTEDSSGHISREITWNLIANGTSTGRISTETDFNAWNLPTVITAYHDPDPNAFPIGLANFPHYVDEVTTLGYDEGLSPARGNLTSITRRDDSGANWTTQLQYDGPEGVFGPPAHITNDVGGVSAVTYDAATGLLTSAASPPNTVVGQNSPDYPTSVTQITGYEEHGLPTMVVDPAGRLTTTGYQAHTNGSPLLDITTTHGADSTFRVSQLDAMDRPALAQDERGVQTAITYNPQDQVKTVTRNSGDMNAANWRTTTNHYSDQGDLAAVDPPAGSGSRVQFDYRQYNQDGTLYTNNGASPNGVYLARLGRVTYADGRVECFGYNPAGELIWERRGDGGVINITRDVAHRIASISYPANGATAAFTVTRNYDEFGRPKQTAGPDGTTDFVWDALNRPAHTILPAPQDSMDFGYQPDATNHRWSSFINVSNLGVWQYSLDSKGRLWQVTNPFSQLFQTDRNLDGSLRQRLFPNGVTEVRGYNARGFLAQIQINQPGVTPAKQFNYSYGYTTGSPPDYDGTGHIRREIDEHGNLTHAFFFDNLYQLVGESGPGLGPGSMTAPYDVNYTFDNNGNRTSRSQGNAVDYYGVDAADRLIWVNRGVNAVPTSGQALPYSLFSWDQDDCLIARDRRDYNLVQQTLFFWHDGAGDLRKVTTINNPSGSPFFDALYNADGIRVEKDDTRAGVLTQNNFSYSPFGLLWSSNPNTIYTPGFGHRSNGVNSFYQTDWLGSTRSVTDITGATVASQSYEAWGSRDQLGQGSPNWPTDMQFAGGWGYQSEYSNLPNEPGLGLDYLQQRYYDPVVGRFMEPDPLGLAAGTNLFEYADDDPVDGVDPLGLDDHRAAWQRGLENLSGWLGAIGGGGGGFFLGGGTALVTTGPAVVITGPTAAYALGAAGSAGGYVSGRAFGHWLGNGLMNAMSRSRGGSSGGGKGCGGSPSEILRQNLIDAGVEPTANSAAHHIVAWDDSRAYLARKILDGFGIDINSAANGVFLPLSRGVQGAFHPAVHTDFYYETVTNLLGLANSPGEAVETLSEIGQLLSAGKFPAKP